MPGSTETARPGDASASRGVYLLSHPRSASNLFQTMMAKQPGHQSSSYKLFDAGFASLTQLDKGRLSAWPVEERNALYGVFRVGFEKLQDELEDARKNGNRVFLKEHAMFLSGPDKIFAHVYNDSEVEPLVVEERCGPHTNPTSMPDNLLLSLTPIFQIRNPILMFPSMVRAESKAMGTIRPRQLMLAATLTLRHSRDLYDWYSNHGDEASPQVIDADDIMNNRAAVRHVCAQTGMDPDAVQYEWETREETNPMKAAFLSTINASKGVIPSLAAHGLDFETEKMKWKAEFGDEDGEDLSQFVVDAMPDYYYLLRRRTYLAQFDHYRIRAAINARCILSGDVYHIITETPKDDLPYCIWFPQLAHSTTYEILVRVRPDKRLQAARACIVGDCQQTYQAINPSHDIALVKEAEFSPNPYLLRDFEGEAPYDSTGHLSIDHKNWKRRTIKDTRQASLESPESVLAYIGPGSIDTGQLWIYDGANVDFHQLESASDGIRQQVRDRVTQLENF